MSECYAQDSGLSLWPWMLKEPIRIEARPTMREIAQRAADRYGLTLDDLRGPGKARRYSSPRHEAMWEMCQTGLWSLSRIGMFFGGRDHTTVLHARDKLNARLSEALTS